MLYPVEMHEGQQLWGVSALCRVYICLCYFHINVPVCVLQSNVPGVKGSAHIIGGSDLLVHTRGKNSELDEWLKDAAEVRPSL